MRLRVLPYIAIVVDIDVENARLRRRLRAVGERWRNVMTGYLRSAADDVETAGDRVRDLCDAAVDRVDTAVANVNDRIAPTPPEEPEAERPKRHLRAV